MVFETFILYGQHLIVQFSYLAMFILSVVSSATIFLPVPMIAIIFFAAELGLNPLLLGIVTGIGSAIGEMTGYLFGAGSEHVVEMEAKNFTKKHKTINELKKLFVRYGFPIIIVCAILPFPFDFVGILAGAANYNLKKFWIATAIGKVFKYTLVAYAGTISLPYLEFLYHEVV